MIGFSSRCGCGCASVSADKETVQVLNLLSIHYHAMFAQYARLGRNGWLMPSDVANWKYALLLHEGLVAPAHPATEPR